MLILYPTDLMKFIFSSLQGIFLINRDICYRFLIGSLHQVDDSLLSVVGHKSFIINKF